jgi:phospholipid/cholesterol/gamma-HCH transport system substrate-binding protein
MATRSRSMEVKVGALILSAVALLVAFLLILGDVRLKAQASLMVDFANSGDIKTGAPVKITGVTVGKVTEVTLWGGRRDPEHGDKIVHVRTRLRLDAEALTLLHDDATFTISTLGVLGEKYVEIDPGSLDHPPLSDGQVVDGTSPMRMDAILGQVTRIAENVDKVVRENREDIREIVKSLKSSLAQVDAGLAENMPAVKDTIEHVSRITDAVAGALGDGEEVKRIVASIRAFAERLDRDAGPAVSALPRVVERIGKAVDEATQLFADGRGLVADGRGVVAEAKGDILASLANVKAMTEKAKDPKSSIGALLSDRELYDDLVALMKDLKRHPWKILWKE